MNIFEYSYRYPYVFLLLIPVFLIFYRALKVERTSKPALIFESDDHVFDLVHDRRLNAFGRLIE